LRRLIVDGSVKKAEDWRLPKVDQHDDSARCERAGWENSARFRNQSDCRICWIPLAHAL